MKNNYKDIGDIYREAFKDYSKKPSAKTWENIEAKLTKPVSVTSGLLKNNYFIAFSSMLIVAVIVFIVLRNTNSIEELNIADPIENVSVIASPENEEMAAAVAVEVEQELTESKTKRKTIEAEKIIPPAEQKDDVEVNLKSEQSESQQELSQSTPEISTDKTEQISSESDIVNNDALNAAEKNIPNKSTTTETGILEQEKPVEETEKTEDIIEDVPIIPIEFPLDQKICRGEKANLEVKGGITYKWNNGEEGSLISINPLVTTIYAVTVTDAGQNLHYGSIMVEVYECSPLFVPDAFTPDGDGLNDVFIAKGTDIIEFDLRVHSRTGKMIFETNNINIGWDGRIDGKMAQPGVYFYTIRFVDSLKKVHNLNGHLTLLR
ncbi:MAG: gliding motility-associated C-terminal domain-containing protein [Bacteroidales bacterium]|nr:gliding motility-associated C-terminal domain-containing protein [Bacteroidales bacterium]